MNSILKSFVVNEGDEKRRNARSAVIIIPSLSNNSHEQSRKICWENHYQNQACNKWGLNETCGFVIDTWM